jgi:type I restriction enzyme S subunit
MVRGPGIIVGRKGSIGAVYYEQRDFWPIDTVFFVEPISPAIDLRFLADLLREIGLSQLNSDAAVPGLNRNVALAQSVRVPPLAVQRKIATILSAYDDLIENSLRRIEILEEMARNFYREWFVEFRFPGHEQCRFVDSPVGRIPEGWTVKRLGDVLELRYGKALKKVDRRPGKVPVYGSSGVIGQHDEALVGGPGVIVGRKGNVGSVFWSPADFFPIDTVFFVTSAVLPLRFLFFDLSVKRFLDSDAAVPGLSRKQALSVETLVPSVDLLDQFCSLVEDSQALAEVLRTRSEALGQARDLLLPRLISGEVDVATLPVRVAPPAGEDVSCRENGVGE